jgi:hypothetical protein
VVDQDVSGRVSIAIGANSKQVAAGRSVISQDVKEFLYGRHVTQ